MAIISDILRATILLGLTFAGILAVLMLIRAQTKRMSYIRTLVQIASVVAIFLTLFLLAQWPSLVFAAIVIIPIVFGRFFCGWICPFGLYMDLISYVRKLLGVRYRNLSEKTNRYLHKLRYAIVGFILSLPLFYGPFNPETWRSFSLFQGQFAPLIVFFLGPLEPLVIPWPGAVGFNGHSLSYPYIREIITFSGGPFFATLNVLVFVALTIAGAFVVRRFWCRFCPTGVSAAAIDKFKHSKWMPLLHIYKEEEKCTKCGICKRVCPVQVTDVYEEKGGDITTSMCMLCMRCVEMCPYEACLKVNMAGKTVIKSRNWLEPSKTD